MKKYKEKDFDFSQWKAFFAFGDDQLKEAKERLGISDNEKLESLGGGLIALKSNYKEMLEAMNKHYNNEREKSKKLNGKDSIIEYELANHECYYTGNIDDAVEVLKEYGYTRDDVLEIYNKTKEFNQNY